MTVMLILKKIQILLNDRNWNVDEKWEEKLNTEETEEQ